MLSIKPLDWQRKKDGTVYAEPTGLEKYYYIYPPITYHDKWCLTKLDPDGKYRRNDVSLHDNQQAAKDEAWNHYCQIINQHVVFEKPQVKLEPAIPPKHMMRAKEVAAYLRIGRSTLDSMQAEGKIYPADYILGRVRMWKLETIQAWLESQKNPKQLLRL